MTVYHTIYTVHCWLYTTQDQKNRQNQTEETPHGLYKQTKVCKSLNRTQGILKYWGAERMVFNKQYCERRKKKNVDPI